MKLTNREKNRLLDAIQIVYLSYLGLDFLKTRFFNSGTLSLQNLCEKAIQEKNFKQTVVIDGVNYQLLLTAEKDNTYKVSFLHALGSRGGNNLLKKISDYTDREALGVLTHQQFSIQYDPQQPIAPIVTNAINHHLTIGGKEIAALNPTHLVTLYHVLEKINVEHQLKPLLVVSPHHASKPHMEVLWLQILALAQKSVIIIAPSDGIEQFSKNLKSLLPEPLKASLRVLDEHVAREEINTTLTSLGNGEQPGQIIIGSAEQLLDQSDDLLAMKGKDVAFVFAEQHRISNTALRQTRIAELSAQNLSMLLSPFPTVKAYQLAERQPVALPSAIQQQEAGRGSFPRLISFHAPDAVTINQLKNYHFWTMPFWESIFNRLLLRLTSTLQEEPLSAAASLVDELPYYHFDTPGETEARWRIQVPTAQKILCVIEDNDALVNFFQAIHHEVGQVYAQGNLVDRTATSHFFHLPNVGSELFGQYQAEKERAYELALQNDEKNVLARPFGFTIKNQLRETIFHNMVEYVLKDCTGLDEIEHNRLRKQDMTQFEQLVIRRFQLRTPEYYRAQLEPLIDPQGAKKISKMLARLSLVLQRFITAEESKEDLRAFVDNWSLDKQLIKRVKSMKTGFTRLFKEYANKHLIVGVMHNMADAETSIVDAKVFGELRKSNAEFNEGSMERANRRGRTAKELLTDNVKRTLFVPQYLTMSEAAADNYFRLGFIPLYVVSNKKVADFEDNHLHTLITIAEHQWSMTNDPEIQMQALSRVANQDSTLRPTYIHATRVNQEGPFPLERFNTDDYCPAFFIAQQKYYTAYCQQIGRQVSHQIVQWMSQYGDEQQLIEPERLKHQVFIFIIQALADLNRKQGHTIEWSHKQMTTLLHAVLNDLDKTIAALKNPYQLPFAIRAWAHVTNFFTSLYDGIKHLSFVVGHRYRRWFGEDAGQKRVEKEKSADTVYRKILAATETQQVLPLVWMTKEFEEWFSKSIDRIGIRFRQNVSHYLTENTKQQYAEYQRSLLEPLLLHCVVEAKRAQVLEAVANLSNPIDFFHAHALFFTHLERQDSVTLAYSSEAWLALLREIPGLEDLQLSDIADYPSKKMRASTFFKGSVLKTVLSVSSLNQALEQRLVFLLQSDFFNKSFLPALMSRENSQLIQQRFMKESEIHAFIQYFLKECGQENSAYDGKSLLLALKSYCQLPGIKLLHEEQTALQTVVTQYQEANLANDLSLMAVGLNQVIPLLARFIKSHDKRQQFIDLFRGEIYIKGFMARHRNGLSFLSSEQQQLSGVLPLINELLPRSMWLTLDDLHDPVSYERTLASSLGHEMQKKLVLTFLNSAVFHEALATVVSPIAQQSLNEILGSEKLSAEIAESMSAINPNHLDQDTIIKQVLAKQSPIRPLEQQMGDFKLFFASLFTDSAKVNQKQSTQLIMQTLTPMLFHHQFMSCVNAFCGALDEEDLTILFTALQRENPNEEAHQLLRLITLLKAGDEQGVYQELLNTSVVNQSWRGRVLVLEKRLGSLFEVMDEAIACHYYPYRGIQSPHLQSKPPKLLNAINERATTDQDPIALEQGTRIDLPLHRLIVSLSARGRINAKANQSLRHSLEQVRASIVRPLWWGSIFSGLSTTLSIVMNNIIQKTMANWAQLSNRLKRGVNWLIGDPIFHIKKQNKPLQSEDDTSEMVLTASTLPAFSVNSNANNLRRDEAARNLEAFLEQSFHGASSPRLFTTALATKQNQPIVDSSYSPMSRG